MKLLRTNIKKVKYKTSNNKYSLIKKVKENNKI